MNSNGSRKAPTMKNRTFAKGTREPASGASSGGQAESARAALPSGGPATGQGNPPGERRPRLRVRERRGSPFPSPPGVGAIQATAAERPGRPSGRAQRLASLPEEAPRSSPAHPGQRLLPSPPPLAAGGARASLPGAAPPATPGGGGEPLLRKGLPAGKAPGAPPPPAPPPPLPPPAAPPRPSRAGKVQP